METDTEILEVIDYHSDGSMNAQESLLTDCAEAYVKYSTFCELINNQNVISYDEFEETYALSGEQDVYVFLDAYLAEQNSIDLALLLIDL